MSQIVSLQIGEVKKDIMIGKVKMGQLPPLLELVGSAAKNLPGVKEAFMHAAKTVGTDLTDEEKNMIGLDFIASMLDAIPVLITQAWKPFTKAIEAVTGLSEEEIRNLNLEDDLSAILKAFFEQNDFASLFGKLKNAAAPRMKAM